jgi:hypothetical protein
MHLLGNRVAGGRVVLVGGVGERERLSNVHPEKGPRWMYGWWDAVYRLALRGPFCCVVDIN